MTIEEIAKLAGVSRGTVDRVIHRRGNVRPETQELVERIIKETGFSPNKAASALKLSANTVRLGVILPDVHNAFYLDIREGILRAADHYAQYGVYVDLIELTELSIRSQTAAIEQLLDRGIQGLALTAIDAPEMIAYIDMISEKLPVVTFNTDFTSSRRLCFVGQDHLSAGRTAGSLLRKSLHKPGVVVPLISYRNILAHTQRVLGLRSLLAACPVPVKVIQSIETKESDAIAYDLVSALLKTRRDITAFFVAGGGQVGAADALQDSGRSEDIIMICHDLLPQTIRHLKSGVVDFTIGQQPFLQGYLPISILYEYVVLKQRPDKEFYYTSIDVRLRENADFNGISAMTGII